MSNTTQEILDTILERMRALATTETVVGEPVTIGKMTLLPVIKLSVGFAAGGGEGKGDASKDASGSGNASAGGGGASINPIGFITWDGESVKFVGVGKGKMDAFFETLPEMLKKVGITLPFGSGKKKAKEAKSSKESESAESNEDEK